MDRASDASTPIDHGNVVSIDHRSSVFLHINCDKQRYYLDLAKSRGRIGSIDLVRLCNPNFVT